MSIKYIKIRDKPVIFKSLFGVSPEEFDVVFKKVEPLWEKKILGSYKRHGRYYKLSLQDMILMLLLYYRSYITQEFVGYLFGHDKSRVCRIIQKLEPLLAGVMAISKRQKLSKEDIESLIIDATEQPVERPKNGQKPYYSGKKKQHTIKTEIRITPKGKIVNISKSRPGSVHDFKLFKESQVLERDTRAFVDLGFLGIDKIHKSSELPYKETKTKKLTPEEKEYNTALARIRIKVENVFREIKIFRILSHKYRNKLKRYNLKFNIIAGIVNLKNGF